MAARNLPRETYPETALDHVLVETVYPGATARDIEEGICIKIEEAIQGIPGIWEITSRSSDGVGLVLAAVNEKIASTADVLRQVRDRVGAITTLPPEAELPVASEVIIRNQVINVGVHGNAPELSIKRIAEEIRDKLAANPAISQVSLSGVRDYEISIKIAEESLQRYGLTLRAIVELVAQSSLDLPAGTVRTQNEEITVRTLGQRYSAREFEDLLIIARPDGTSVRLGDVAEVSDTFEETPVFGRINGEPGARIAVFKTGTEDISEIARIVRDFVDAARPMLPEGIELSIWGDGSRDVDARIAMLFKNALMGMVLVLGCLILFMDWRTSAAVAVGIPVSFAGALIVISHTGGTLNMISLLGLLMATGIIVDDAIVIAESARAQARKGLEPELATIKGVGIVATPVLMASLTTIVTFIPLMHVEGVMGKLIYVLPVGVIAAVVFSGLEAFAILPAHICEWTAHSERAGRVRLGATIRERLDAAIDGFIARRYAPLLDWAVRRRGLVVCGAFAALMVCTGLVFGRRIPFVLFPPLDTNLVRSRLQFPEGTPIDVSMNAVLRMERAALALNDEPELRSAETGPLVRQIYSDVGEWPEYVPKRASSLCETSIELMPAEDRRIDVAKIMEHWRKNIGTIPDVVTMEITREQLGPVQKPIEVRLRGDDLEELRRAADELIAKLESYHNVFNIEDELAAGKRQLQVTLRPSARNLGITVGDLARQVRQGLYGAEAVRLQRGTDEIRVMVSYADAERRSMGAFENLRIRTPTGAEVPFSEVADTKLVRSYASITRQDGTRRCSVRADVDERFANAEQIMRDLEGGFLPELEAKHAGVAYLIDGERKRIDESLGSLLRGACIAGVVMFALLGTVMRSYAQPIIVMVAIPLDMIGAVLGHGIMGYDLTLMSAFGMVALAGIAVNDSLVLIDRINRNVADGMRVSDAVTDAGKTRFRAVILTTVTTVAGLLPLIAERSSQAQSLIPLAISIAFGEAFGTVLTLFIVPAMFLVVNDAKRGWLWLGRGGSFPRAEDVERDAPPAGGAAAPVGEGAGLAGAEPGA